MFKPGDAVVCIDNMSDIGVPHLDLHVGATYMVTSTSSDDELIGIDGSFSDWYPRRFLLVKDLTPLEKVIYSI